MGHAGVSPAFEITGAVNRSQVECLRGGKANAVSPLLARLIFDLACFTRAIPLVGVRANRYTTKLHRAVAAAPSNGYALDSLGWAYFKLGNLSSAERYLTEAARISTNSATVQEHLGDLHERQGDMTKARTAWQKALSLPTEPDQNARLKARLNGEAKK